jgi:hypothetical protein
MIPFTIYGAVIGLAIGGLFFDWTWLGRRAVVIGVATGGWLGSLAALLMERLNSGKQ